MFAKRVCLEMAPAKWQGRALIFSLLAEGKILRVMPVTASKTLTLPQRRASAMAPNGKRVCKPILAYQC